MIKIFDKIPKQKPKEFSMPLSLRIIKECAENGIEWKYLHIADLFSIIYEIRIESANTYLESQRKKRMHDRGIDNIRQCTLKDFNNL